MVAGGGQDVRLLKSAARLRMHCDASDRLSPFSANAKKDLLRAAQSGRHSCLAVNKPVLLGRQI